jgi:hypothetical protein
VENPGGSCRGAELECEMLRQNLDATRERSEAILQILDGEQGLKQVN